MSESPNDIVGHKTIYTGERDEDGFPKHRHEPLTRAEASAIWESAEAAKAKRASDMPDVRTAIDTMWSAYQRLRELGWRDPVYCPKDGSHFEVIEPGSTGIHKCYYSGEWPNGHWNVIDDMDVYPSRPVLFKLFPEDQAKEDARWAEGKRRFQEAMASGQFNSPPNSEDAG